MCIGVDGEGAAVGLREVVCGGGSEGCNGAWVVVCAVVDGYFYDVAAGVFACIGGFFAVGVDGLVDAVGFAGAEGVSGGEVGVVCWGCDGGCVAVGVDVGGLGHGSECLAAGDDVQFCVDVAVAGTTDEGWHGVDACVFPMSVGTEQVGVGVVILFFMDDVSAFGFLFIGE